MILQGTFQILNRRFERCPKKKSCLCAERNFSGKTLNYTKLIYLKKLETNMFVRNTVFCIFINLMLLPSVTSYFSGIWLV